MQTNPTQQQGGVNPLVVVNIVLVVLVLGLTGATIWAYTRYTDQKNNVDQKIAAAVADAKRQQGNEDESKFAEREKQPTRTFIGPEDLGRVQLSYPKTWSVYVDKNGGASSDYQAYFQPNVVPPLVSKTPYALRVSIENKSYDQVLLAYQDLVKKGELKSSPVAIQGQNGNRLDGNFSKDIQGSMVLFKVRDKTLEVYTQSRTFQADFDQIILASLNFNP